MSLLVLHGLLLAAGPLPGSEALPAWRVESAEELERLLADPDGPERMVLAPGVFEGHFTIRRPVELEGELGATLSGGGSGTVLHVDATDVRISNLFVEASGRSHTAEDSGIRARGARVTIERCAVSDVLFGITLEQCRDCLVADNHVQGDAEATTGDGIKLWEAHGSRLEDNLVEGVRDVVVWYSRQVSVGGNTVRRSRYGTHFMYAHELSVHDNRYEDNVVGVFIMYSKDVRLARNVLAGAGGAAGMGLGAKESERLELSGNWFVANTTGIYLDRSPRTPAEPVRFVGNTAALNDVALRLHGKAAGVHFEGNDFLHDARLVEIEGGGDALGVSLRDNFYSDYAGYDLDEDGTGDVAFEVKALSQHLTDERPVLRLFSGSLALELIDAVAKAFPVFAARRLLVDETPRTRPGGNG